MMIPPISNTVHDKNCANTHVTVRLSVTETLSDRMIVMKQPRMVMAMNDEVKGVTTPKNSRTKPTLKKLPRMNPFSREAK